MEPQAAAAPLQPTNPPTTPALEPVPATWPGGFGLFKHAKQAYMTNVGPNLIILAISIVIGYPLQKALGSTGSLISELIAIVLSVAAARLYLAGGKGQKLSLGEAFPKDFMVYLKFLGLQIIVGLSALISVLLLVIPAFFVIPRLSLANYFLLDKDMGVMDAYKASWDATKGHVGKVYGIFGASLVFAVLILVLVGIYLSIVYATAYALLYLYLQQNSSTGSVESAQPAPAAPTTTPETPISSAPQDVQSQPPVTPSTPPQVQ